MAKFKQRAVTTAITTPSETLIRRDSSPRKIRVKIIPMKAENPATTPFKLFIGDFTLFMALGFRFETFTFKTA
jgi:hypothetical protein